MEIWRTFAFIESGSVTLDCEEGKKSRSKESGWNLAINQQNGAFNTDKKNLKHEDTESHQLVNR